MVDEEKGRKTLAVFMITGSITLAVIVLTVFFMLNYTDNVFNQASTIAYSRGFDDTIFYFNVSKIDYINATIYNKTLPMKPILIIKKGPCTGSEVTILYYDEKDPKARELYKMFNDYNTIVNLANTIIIATLFFFIISILGTTGAVHFTKKKTR